MHQAGFRLVHPGVVDIVEDRDDDLQDVATLENMIEELSVVLTQLPEQNQELLVEMDFLLRSRQICLGQRVHQQPGDS